MFEATRILAKEILKNSQAFSWSLQGLGMLRLHMDDFRLHVWDLRFAFPDASPMHDHQQWALESLILSGRLRNNRYIESADGTEYMHVKLRAGYGCKFLEEPTPIRLRQSSSELYGPGCVYRQEPQEIHWSIPDNGTVTIMRKFPTPDGETARVFWPKGEQWGSAEPRRATSEEIQTITKYALEVWGA